LLRGLEQGKNNEGISKKNCIVANARRKLSFQIRKASRPNVANARKEKKEKGFLE
jgi:hypothetical protein